MVRRLVSLLVLCLITSLSVVVPASAAPVPACFQTEPFKTYQWAWNGEYYTTVGTYFHSFVGSSAATLTTSYRTWHVTYKGNGDSIATYSHAYAVRCDAEDGGMGEVDLTRSPGETLSEFDLRCGTASFTSGNTSYQLVGSRSFLSTTWRYWSTKTTSPMLTYWGVTAARCA
ncbi:hypothetical protein AB0A74_15135 [Saccharothrix sp. NPDC042600]|uniref:hypothetical protein n=1 Tax=Saccharothrix TaxID=2071 RepID=UPI0033F174FA|nr:hypothetical protein GCM10017745_52990 [Saccharothrix mutabilis subsp. capreolus]